jgi:hypothetical protein
MLIVAMVKDLFAPKGACLSSKLTARADRRFEFYKRSQLFIRAHNEAFDRRRDVRQQSTSFARSRPALRRSPNSNRLC